MVCDEGNLTGLFTLLRCRSILVMLEMGCGQKGLNILSHRFPLVSTALRLPSTVHSYVLSKCSDRSLELIRCSVCICVRRGEYSPQVALHRP